MHLSFLSSLCWFFVNFSTSFGIILEAVFKNVRELFSIEANYAQVDVDQGKKSCITLMP
jgi:hypothetical protein